MDLYAFGGPARIHLHQRTLHVIWKTCEERWMVGKDGESLENLFYHCDLMIMIYIYIVLQTEVYTFKERKGLYKKILILKYLYRIFHSWTVFIFFSALSSLSLSIYIYIYMCVCVCVSACLCVFLCVWRFYWRSGC